MTLTKGHLIRNTGRTRFKVGHPGYWLGKSPPRHPPSSVAKRSAENSVDWKGDEVSYNGLHKWVNKHYGRPDTCEHCKTSGLSGHKIHWANKSHEYKRDREDWLRLCVKCHIQYDKKI